MKLPAHYVVALALAISSVFSTTSQAQEEGATVGPWRVGDMAYSTTLADDRPNELSRQIVAKNYKPLAPDKTFKGEKGVLSFRVSPRTEGWAGILVLDQQNKPIPLSAGMTVALSDPDGKPQAGKSWIGRDTKAQHAHQDIHAAIRDAFDAARRQLEDYARDRRGEVKTHTVPDHGRIVRFLPEQDCGFILSADGREIYFHRNSVAGDAFDKLRVGDEVRFVAQESESALGPQASTVVPQGKHHLPPVGAVRA